MRAVGITLLAFLLSLLFASPISFSVTSLFSSPEKEDSQLSDFFAQVADRRPVRQLDREIVLVDIGSAGREEIAGLMEVLALCDPKAVGLDVMFADRRDDDGRLIDALRSVPNLVMPVAVSVGNDGTVDVTEESYFQHAFPHGEGVVNLASKHARGTIREFPTWFRTAGGDSIASFPVAVALTAHPDLEGVLKERGNAIEIIDYPSREFDVIPIADASDRAEELLGKIVIVGAFDDASDLHATPIASMVPGVLIHAYAVGTVDNGKYYHRPGMLTDWILAFLLCLFNVWISMVIDARVKGLVVRLIQLLVVYIAMQIGYYLFVEHRVIINLTYTLLMITFGIFAADIWNGTQGAVKIVKEKVQKRRATRYL